MRIRITADDDTYERLLNAHEKLIEIADELPWRDDVKEVSQEIGLCLGRLSAKVTESDSIDD